MANECNARRVVQGTIAGRRAGCFRAHAGGVWGVGWAHRIIPGMFVYIYICIYIYPPPNSIRHHHHHPAVDPHNPTGKAATAATMIMIFGRSIGGRGGLST
jgi:hypothetical protein